MAVDIRAKVFCNLGEVISGGWSDDHCQGTGLIRCRGDLTLKGAKSVAVGTKVQFALQGPAGASQFPRQFRVLSCFADPFARTTTIQMGCTLTYLENLVAATEKDGYFYSKEDENNKDLDCALYDVALLPISADSVAKKCMSILGITGSPNLTNFYAAEKFSLKDGYVQVLNDLLYAEAKVGYMLSTTALNVVDISNFSGTAASVNENSIIEYGPIGGGESPASAIAVSYTYKKYKQPETTASLEDRWEKEEVTGPLKKISLPYSTGTYEAVTQDYTKVETTYDRFNRKKKTTTTTRRHLAEVNPSYIQKLLDAKELYPSVQPVIAPVENITEEVYDYEREAEELQETPGETAGECLEKKLNADFYDPSKDDQPVQVRNYVYVSDTEIAGSLSVEQYHFVDPQTQAVEVFHPGTAATRLATYTETNYSSYKKEGSPIFKKDDPDIDVTKTTTETKRAFYLVLQGQQSGATETSTLIYDDGSDIQGLINRMTVLYSDGIEVRLVSSPDFGTQKRPDPAALSDQKNIKGTTVIEDETVLEFVTGDAESQNVRVYNLPLAPDDRVFYAGGGYPGNWNVITSDHKAKALKFARAQQAVSFGHANGVSVQLSARDMPPYPLDGIALSGLGATGLFRVDGLSWSFDANGIVCNADCLAWGGLGLSS